MSIDHSSRYHSFLNSTISVYFVLDNISLGYILQYHSFISPLILHKLHLHQPFIPSNHHHIQPQQTMRGFRATWRTSQASPSVEATITEPEHHCTCTKVTVQQQPSGIYIGVFPALAVSFVLCIGSIFSWPSVENKKACVGWLCNFRRG